MTSETEEAVDALDWKAINSRTAESYGIEFSAFIARLPPGREMSLAITKMEEAVMWKGITK